MSSSELPPIPAKRYFTIGEVSELCGVKPHVLRYWEQEFSQLRPMKRRGNRRYYQHREVLMVRRIRQLLYEQGFTINGARNKLQEAGLLAMEGGPSQPADGEPSHSASLAPASGSVAASSEVCWRAEDSERLLQELWAIRQLLMVEEVHADWCLDNGARAGGPAT